ncbi:hypothetical protein [Methylopila sp. M107]|uniref:hypothetical protein n=1 Tax=Methylopila sp. M107 TaxID=1101190 RepID=UPI0003718340|nr:hypothetical protein [Methylopila sp. M107]
MRLILAAAFSLAAISAAEATCFRECLATKIQSSSDDDEIRKAAKACRETCEAKTRASMEADGTLASVTDCKPEPLSLTDLRKLRAETASYYVQSNTFIWDFKNPFPDRTLTRVEVTAQNMDLNQIGFTGAGLVPPSGEGAFVIPAFFDGYPAVRFAAKVEKVWACPVKR